MKKTASSNLRLSTIRVSRIHFLYVAAIAIQVLLYDVWKLITPQVLMQRWLVATVLLVATSAVWFTAKSKPQTNAVYRRLIIGLALVDVFVATFAIYTQRGMASRAVFLYVIPIVTVAVLKSRSAILAMTAICVAAYTSAALSYFVLNFNEGYKIELYGEVGFYSIGMFIVAFLVWTAIRPHRKD